MSAELLRATEVGRRLGISTRDVIGLIYERQIRYVMRRGIPHIPVDAVEEYRGHPT